MATAAITSLVTLRGVIGGAAATIAATSIAAAGAITQANT
jgi:hypothetical protein